jgi:hypothetical protein
MAKSAGMGPGSKKMGGPGAKPPMPMAPGGPGGMGGGSSMGLKKGGPVKKAEKKGKK